MMRAFWLCLALSVAACGSDSAEEMGDDAGPDAGAPDPSEAFFAPDHLVEVSVELPESEWDALRFESRGADILFVESCQDQPFGSPFTYREATVTVDGQRFERAGIRKKGFLGSLDDQKPSLKIKLDKFVPDQRYLGLERITLNNNKQDPSHIRQCLGFDLFRAAGVPAPRCNFAHVTVNGRDMGVFSNIEAVKQRFLARYFDDNDGRLYEGTLSDFRPNWTETFEAKTHENDPDRSDLAAMRDALEREDPFVVAAIEQNTDLDRFMRFWAMEVLLVHGDGYAGNTNNFFVYNDPETGLLEFFPWGIDQIMPEPGDFGEGVSSGSTVLANGMISRRLYLIPEARDRYMATMRDILDTAWDETRLQAEIDRMESLIAEFVENDPLPTQPLFADSVEGVRSFVTERRAHVEAAIDSPPTWDRALRDSFCFIELGDVSASFDTTYKVAEPPNIFLAGTGDLNGTLDGSAITFNQLGSNAGPDEAGMVQIQVILDVSPSEILFFVAKINQQDVQSSQPVPLGFFSSFVARFNPQDESFAVIGILLNASIQFTAAGTTDGAPMVGSFTGDIYSSPF